MTGLSNMRILLVIAVFCFGSSYAVEDYPITCCEYCRSEPGLWYSLGGAFALSADQAVTSLNSPPAYLAGDEETVQYTDDGRNLKLHYAGAPVKLTHTDMSDEQAVINEQYVQIDLSSPKKIGGVMIQGGFYEEVVRGVFPYKESWVTEYVVSYSNTSKDFQLATSNGGLQIFQGLSSVVATSVASLPSSVTARYLRIHPLRGQNDEGIVNRVNIRATVLTCEPKVCFNPRINCLLSHWASWSACSCVGVCTRYRDRVIRRVQACGGARCGDLKETETCVPPEPAWKAIIQYLGIVLGIFVVIGIIAFIIYRKTHRNRVQDIIIVKDSDDGDDFDVNRSSKARESEVVDTGPMSTYRNFEDRPAQPPPYNSQASGVPPMSSDYMGYGGDQNTGSGRGSMAVLGGLGGYAPMDY